MFYRTEVIADQSFTLWEQGFSTFFCTWPPWPDDLYIRTWHIFPGYMPDVQIWTSYVKAFKS